MSATNYAVLTPRLRILADDAATSKGNLHLGETPTGTRDGSNKTFRLAFQNPVTASLYMTYGTTVRTQAGFTILDGPTGYLTVDPAPDSGTTQPFYFDYAAYLYLDAEYQSMLDEGTDWLGGTIGTDLAEGLYPAQTYYALSMFYTRRASEKAPQFASSGGGIGAQPQTPAQAFTKLADWALRQAIIKRDDFYKRQGQREAPASGTIHYGISPNQTPY